MNRAGEKIRPGKQPKGRFLDAWSLIDGDKLLVGVARWVNHSCGPNCDYYKWTCLRSAARLQGN